MPQLRVDVDGFNLNATWNCYCRDNSSGGYSVWQVPSELPKASKTITFTYEMPKRAKINSVKVHSSWGGSLFGINGKFVDGVAVGDDGFVIVDNPDDSATSIAVEFLFVAEKDNPQVVHEREIEDILNAGLSDHTYTIGSHTSSALVSEVYLLIEYEEDKGGYIYHAENGELVPYVFYRAEGGVLVPYYLFGAPRDYELVTQNMLTASGDQFYTADGKTFQVVGGEA